MNKTYIAKQIAGLVVGFGTAKLVKMIVFNNVSPDSVTDKAAVVIGSYVLGTIAADAAKDWTDAKIDELIAQWMKLVKEVKSATV